MTMTSTAWPTAAEGRRQRPATGAAAGPNRGVVHAAVDDSSHAAAVVRRAAAVAAAEDRELVLVTVVPAGASGSVATGLDRLALLAPATVGLTVEPVEVVEVVAKYQARGGQRRRSRRVGSTILRVARAYGAAVIVIGLPDHEHQRDRSVSRRIAHGAPATTRVALVPRTEAAGSYEWPAAEIASRPLPATAGMNAKDRRRLVARAHQLQSVELPRLRRALDSNRPVLSGTSGKATAEYEAALTDLRTLRHQLDTTPPW